MAGNPQRNRSPMTRRKPPALPRLDPLSPEQRAEVHQALRGMASVLTSRAQLAESLGKTFGGERDLYKAAGYPLTIKFEDYGVKFERLGIARRVVSAYPDATWSYPPTLKEGEGEEETAFEKDIAELSRQLRLWHYIRRIDTVSGIGRYGVLFIGFNDGGDFNEEVPHGAKPLYLQPYTEAQAEPGTLEDDPHNERYGLPATYQIRMGSENDDLTTTISRSKSVGRTTVVHYSRVLHVADGRVTSDMYGTPRMKPVYNELINIETLMAGATEMFWKGGFPGYTFEAHEGTSMTPQTLTEIQEELEGYFHGLQRYLRVQGMDVKPLAVQVASPKEHLMANVQLISAQTGIPARILLGSEMGQLASQEDKANWLDRVDERRLTYAEPLILRPLVDRLIEVGSVSAPAAGEYTVAWPELMTASDEDQAKIAEMRTKALAAYVGAPGADLVVPELQLLTGFLGMDPEEAREMLEVGARAAEDERKQEQEEAEMRKAEELEWEDRDADLARELAEAAKEGAAA